MKTLKAKNGEKSVLILGLSELDILSIRDAKQPVQISLNGEMGNTFDICLIYGDTDEEMQKTFIAAGMAD